MPAGGLKGSGSGGGSKSRSGSCGYAIKIGQSEWNEKIGNRQAVYMKEPVGEPGGEPFGAGDDGGTALCNSGVDTVVL